MTAGLPTAIDNQMIGNRTLPVNELILQVEKEKRKSKIMSLPLPPTANLDTENGDKSWKDRKKPVVINKVSI